MKTIRRSLCVAAVSALALSGLGLSASADEPGRDRVRVDKPQIAVVARGLIVKTTTPVPSGSLLRAADAALDSDASVTDSDKLTGRVSTVDFDASVPAAVAAEAAAEITKRSDVVWAAPNTFRRAESSSPVPVNDTFFKDQRNLWDSATKSPAGGYSIKAPSLWRATEGSPNVVVAVVDTGVYLDHPDLAGQLVPGYDMVDDVSDNDETPGRDNDPSDPGDWAIKGQCGEYDDGTPLPAENSSWHGTFVAGIVAAKTDNGQGVAGVAPGVKVQPVRALGQCGGWDSDIIAGITWASGGHVAGVATVNATPAKVVNLSLGSTHDTKADRDVDCAPYAEAAEAGRQRGSVVVAAAGNDSADANLAVPASCPGYISVGATSNKGFGSWYSNRGSSVDISAPGGDTVVEGSADSIRSTVNSGTRGPLSGGLEYLRYEGTSTAAPEVSAGAALLYSLGLSGAGEVENALRASVSSFRGKSSSYAKKKIKIDGHTYVFDLNCAGHNWCGKGILDLSKVPAPIGGPTILGNIAVGEPLSAAPGTWNATPSVFTYQWLRDGATIAGATAPNYTVNSDDVDAELSVRLAPSNTVFRSVASTSSASAAVLRGPSTTLTGLSATQRYGTDGTATVTVGSVDAPVNGSVELRRGSTVIASGSTTDGSVTFSVPGLNWIGGANLVRAAFLGSGTDNPAASSGSQTVTVAKATSAISTTLPKTVKKSKKAKLTVTVTAPGVAAPTGTFKVYDGRKKILTSSLDASHSGKRTVSLPKITKKGKHKIKVVYAGNGNIVGKTSSVKTLTVK